MTIKPRTILFWMHLTAGSLAGIVILVLSLTGVLLMYEQQIVSWSERGYDLDGLPADAGRIPMPMETLLARVGEQRKGMPSAITLRSDVFKPIELAYGRQEIVFVNPYSGQVIGEGSRRVRGFFRRVEDWHRWLGMEGHGRAVGRAITGACNLVFLFIVVSGLYLWWPRQWGWRRIRPVLWFRRGLSGRPRDFNWHSSIGFWCAIPLFLVVISGAVMSYPWANDLLYRMTGNEPPPRPAVTERSASALVRRNGGREGNADAALRSGPDVDGMNQLWERAREQAPGWKVITLRLPRSGRDTFAFSIERGGRGRVDLRSQLILDRDGSVVSVENFESYNAGRRLRSWLRFIHTGEAGGLPGQTVAGFASMGALMLVWTGLSMSWYRFRQWRRTRFNTAKRVPEDVAVCVE